MHLLDRVQRETLEAKAEAVRHIRLDRVPLNVGVGETVGQRKISEAVERYRHRLPEAEIELIVETEDALLQGLREGRFDIVVSVADVPSDLYSVDPLYSESYRVVVAADHALSKSTAVSLEQLANINMLDRPNCEMREALHKTCAEHGQSLYAIYRSNRVDWLLELARNGSGAVILPATAIPKGDDLVSLPIEGVEFTRQVVGLRYRHQPTRREADELLRELALPE